MLNLNKPIIIGVGLLTLFAASTLLPLAAAQYTGVGGGGNPTLEEQLALARAKVQLAAANPHTGSGTPVLDATGIVGASIAVGAVFGGIFIIFVVRAKQAKKIQ